MADYNYRKGIPSLLLCLAIWGFQPLYWMVCPSVGTLLLMVLRIVWAGVFCLILVLLTGRWNQLVEVFTTPSIFLKELPASVFLAVDWFVYLFAVQSGRIQETSLGYYIMPLVSFLFGVLFFKEDLHWQYLIMLGLVITGIVLSVESFGRFPYVSLILSLAFACYAAIKKSLHLDSIVSTSSEILIMFPFALVYLVFFSDFSAISTTLSLSDHLLIVGSGLVTALPMLLYAIALDNLPMTLIGFLQYLSPTFALICSSLLGESFSLSTLRSFLFIWAGVLLFVLYTFRTPRQKA